MENSANLFNLLNLSRVLTLQSEISQTIHLFCELLFV